MPGRNTLTATARGPVAVATFRAMHLRDRGGGDRRTEARKHRATGLSERGGDRRLRPPPAGTAACGPAGVRDRGRARRRRRRAASPGTGRASRSSGRAASAPPKPRLRGAGRAPLEQARDAACSGAPAAGSGAGSTMPKTPSRAKTKPARPRRKRCAGAGNHKRQPECSATMPPVMSLVTTRGANPAARIIAAKACGLREAADRFHQVAIRLPITRNGAAERRDDVERVKIIQPSRPGTSTAENSRQRNLPPTLQYAKRLGQRHIDPRHIADAERNRHGIEAAICERQRFRIACRKSHAGMHPLPRRALAPDIQHVRH